MWSVESQPTFRRNALHAYAGSKLQVTFLLGLFFDPQNDGEMLLWNVDRLPRDYIQKLQRFINTSVRASNQNSWCLGGDRIGNLPHTRQKHYRVRQQFGKTIYLNGMALPWIWTFRSSVSQWRSCHVLRFTPRSAKCEEAIIHPVLAVSSESQDPQLCPLTSPGHQLTLELAHSFSSALTHVINVYSFHTENLPSRATGNTHPNRPYQITDIPWLGTESHNFRRLQLISL
jgi:hypothetical protein